MLQGLEITVVWHLMVCWCYCVVRDCHFVWWCSGDGHFEWLGEVMHLMIQNDCCMVSCILVLLCCQQGFFVTVRGGTAYWEMKMTKMKMTKYSLYVSIVLVLPPP